MCIRIFSLSLHSCPPLLFCHSSPPCCFSPVPPLAPPSFNYFCLTFYLPACPPSLCWAGWREQGQGGVKRGRKKRGEEDKIRPPTPPLLPLYPPIVWRVCSESPYCLLSSDGKKFICAVPPAVSHWRISLLLPLLQQMNVNEKFQLGVRWSHLHTPAIVYFKMVSLKLKARFFIFFLKKNVFLRGPGCNNMSLVKGLSGECLGVEFCFGACQSDLPLLPASAYSQGAFKINHRIK